jgi:hypothetical protein
MSYEYHGIRQLGDDFPDNRHERRTGFQPVMFIPESLLRDSFCNLG